MALTLEQVRGVAQLARLSLTEEEERRYQVQLSAILEAVEALGALDTDAVEPTSHAVYDAPVLREDIVRPSLGAQRAVAHAPAKVGTSFAVPKIIE